MRTRNQFLIGPCFLYALEALVKFVAELGDSVIVLLHDGNAAIRNRTLHACVMPTHTRTSLRDRERAKTAWRTHASPVQRR